MHKVTATLDQEQHVRSSVSWNRRWGQGLGDLYFNEELAGPDGMSIQLFVTKDTSDLIIQAAEQQAYEEGDVVSIHALIVPAEWLEPDPRDRAVSADIHCLRQIADTHTAYTLRWPDGESQLVDVTTASVLVKVYDALRPDLEEKIGRMISRSRADFLRAVDIAWSVIK